MRTNPSRSFFIALAAGLAVGGAAVLAQESSERPGGDRPPATSEPGKKALPPAPTTPEKILAKLHHVNLFEIEVGELAKERGTTGGVRELGETLIRDHQAADEKVYVVAERLGIELPAEPKPETEAEEAEQRAHAELMGRLRTLDATPFDEAFVAAMLEGHEKAIAMFTAAREKTQSADVKALLDEILPHLCHHRDIAAKLMEGNARLR